MRDGRVSSTSSWPHKVQNGYCFGANSLMLSRRKGHEMSASHVCVFMLGLCGVIIGGLCH